MFRNPAGIRRKRAKTVAEEDFNLLKDDVFVLGVIELGVDLPDELYESAQRKLKTVRRIIISKSTTLINKYVPRDSGELRKAMIRTIRGSYADPVKLIIFFGSQRRKTAKYMHIVNENYNKYQLAHKGKKKSRATGKILYDPNAREGFIGIISKKLWREMRKNVTFMRNRLKHEYERNKNRKASKEELKSWVRFKGQL